MYIITVFTDGVCALLMLYSYYSDSKFIAKTLKQTGMQSVSTCVCACVCACACVCVHVHLHSCVCARVYVCVHAVHTCVCVTIYKLI